VAQSLSTDLIKSIAAEFVNIILNLGRGDHTKKIIAKDVDLFQNTNVN
jgi:hypothetical protein